MKPKQILHAAGLLACSAVFHLPCLWLTGVIDPALDNFREVFKALMFMVWLICGLGFYVAAMVVLIKHVEI